jgi:uncharacterized protein (TIGR03435 family)
MSGSNIITIFDAFDKQLGLKLAPGSTPLPVLTVVSVAELPTPNPPGTADALPPPPTEFEVAVINPGKPGTRFSGFRLNGTQLTLQGASLGILIAYAWEVDYQRLAGAPPWIDTDLFDILAKAPTPAKDVPAVGNSDLTPMLRRLLADRFQVKAHLEDRPGDAWVLVAANPKLRKADPTARSLCKQGPGADGKDPRSSVRSRLITCQNVTMAQFAELLLNFETEYVGDSAVFDSTNLAGAYDLTVSYSTAPEVWSSTHAAQPSPAPPALPRPATPPIPPARSPSSMPYQSS